MTPNKPLIAVVEDDDGLVFVYEELLGARYDLRIFRSLQAFTDFLAQDAPHIGLIIADVRLEDGYLLDFLTLADGSTREMPAPFIVVSSLDDNEILRQCFAKGATDYMVKPVRRSEVVVKVDRLVQPSPANGSASSPIKLDALQQQLVLGDKSMVQLTPTESRILAAFLRSSELSLRGREIRAELWGGSKTSRKTLDTHMFNLRRKLQPAAYQIVYVEDDVYLLTPRLVKDS